MIPAGQPPLLPRLPSLVAQIQGLAGAARLAHEEAALKSKRKGIARVNLDGTLYGQVYQAMVPGVRYNVDSLKALLPPGASAHSASDVAGKLARLNLVFKRGLPRAFTYERPMPGASS